MDRPPPDPGNTDPGELTEDNPDLDRDREDLAKEPIRQQDEDD